MTWAMLAVQSDDGLTVSEVLRSIPHDAAAFFVYSLMAIFVGLIWMGSRRKE